jgi:N-acetylglutamate synthase-like GNAT family acetyltransferase
MMRPEVKVRLAVDAECERIQKLVHEAGFTVGSLEWSRIYPHWLVAEIHGNVVGCVQLCLGLPIARAEMLGTEQGLAHRDKAVISRELLLACVAAARQYGATALSGLVAFENKSFKRLLKRRGAFAIASGNLFVVGT